MLRPGCRVARPIVCDRSQGGKWALVRGASHKPLGVGVCGGDNLTRERGRIVLQCHPAALCHWGKVGDLSIAIRTW